LARWHGLPTSIHYPATRSQSPLAVNILVLFLALSEV
jgi:hypothetical protein